MMIMNNGWECAVVRVSPEMAAEWLQHNEGNRRIRAGVVIKYAAVMARGKWLTTPEPIVFSWAGRLLNGQHRLSAVIRAGISVPMFVVRNVDPSAFVALDRGATRTVADALGIDKRLAEVARLAAIVCGNRERFGGSGQQVLDDEVQVMAEALHDDHAALLDACPSMAKVFSSAPFRLAASLRTMTGEDALYVHEMYRNLVLGNIGALPPVGQAIAGAALSGRLHNVSSHGFQKQLDWLARALVVFNKSHGSQRKVQIKNAWSSILAATEVLRPAVQAHQPAAAATRHSRKQMTSIAMQSEYLDEQ